MIKKIKGKDYYYSFLSYFLIDKSKSFSKYIGIEKPTGKELDKIENLFKEELIHKISGKDYSAILLSADEVIKTLLFSSLFNRKYQNLTDLLRRKYDIDSIILFTLTTLTTEEVDVSLNDVETAFDKKSRFTQREQISKNMLNAVESIKQQHKMNKKYLLELHQMIMASFETKMPGKFRNRQVYLYRHGGSGPAGDVELSYRPPRYNKLNKLLGDFFAWYDSSSLNPVEKAAVAHYNLYKIHPFLDGNKRICRLIFNKTLLDNRFPLINISIKKEEYFDALIVSVENNNPKVFVDFALKQYYSQVKEFLIG
ncbi:MAG: Fic family protein [Candidatus Micrarchaeales archaeon]